MSERAKNLAWIDLETTGADEMHGSVLEVGVVISAPTLQTLVETSWLVYPDPEHLASMEPVVAEMHQVSGLMDDIRAYGGADLKDVDRALEWLLRDHAVKGQCVLAGSGVGHFDSRWIRRHLPRSARRLTYAFCDVGTVRRFLASVDAELVRPAPPKAHRGLDDARDHLNEWRHYAEMMREASTPLRVAAERLLQSRS